MVKKSSKLSSDVQKLEKLEENNLNNKKVVYKYKLFNSIIAIELTIIGICIGIIIAYLIICFI